MGRKIAFSSSAERSPASRRSRFASVASRPAKLSLKKLSWNCRRSIDIRVHQHLVHHRKQPLGRERLLDESRGAERGRFLDVHVARVAREDEDGRGRVGLQLFECLDQIQAAHARHLDIRDDQVHALELREVERLFAARRLGDLIADVLENLGDDLPDGGDVVDDHDSRHGGPYRTFLRVSSRTSGLKGLTIQPVAPALLPFCLRSVPASVVSTRIGMNLQSGSARRLCTRSMPFMPGMLTSVITRSNFFCFAVASAWLPSGASTTSCPALVRVKATLCRMVVESSTTRICAIACPLRKARPWRCHPRRASPPPAPCHWAQRAPRLVSSG